MGLAPLRITQPRLGHLSTFTGFPGHAHGMLAVCPLCRSFLNTEAHISDVSQASPFGTGMDANLCQTTQLVSGSFLVPLTPVIWVLSPLPSLIVDHSVPFCSIAPNKSSAPSATLNRSLNK